LVTFLCPSKEKLPAVGQPPTSNTRAKPARLFTSWIPAFAGMTAMSAAHKKYNSPCEYS
jgi:hypothetical protein